MSKFNNLWKHKSGCTNQFVAKGKWVFIIENKQNKTPNQSIKQTLGRWCKFVRPIGVIVIQIKNQLRMVLDTQVFHGQHKKICQYVHMLPILSQVKKIIFPSFLTSNIFDFSQIILSFPKNDFYYEKSLSMLALEENFFPGVGKLSFLKVFHPKR